MRIDLYDGKYTYINDEKGQRALRYGEEWRDLIGDGFIMAMAQEIERLQEELEEANWVINEANDHAFERNLLD